MILVVLFLRLKRCQVNDCKPSGTPAYGWKRPSRAKTAADHPVSPLPPGKGWGKIKEVFKAFRERGVVPNWTAYRKAQVIKRYKPWMHLHMLRALRLVPLQVTWRKYRAAGFRRAVPEPLVCTIAFGYARICNQGCVCLGLARRNGTRRHGRMPGFLRRNLSESSWTARRPKSEQRANSCLMMLVTSRNGSYIF